MGKDNYLCVDAVLTSSPVKDCRQAAFTLLKTGSDIGMLDLTIGVVARRFALRERAVSDWYKAKLLEEAATDGKK